MRVHNKTSSRTVRINRAICVILTAALFVSGSVFTKIPVKAANTAESLISVAEGELGSTNYTKYYGGHYNAWCADFVSWCAQQAGVPSIYLSSSCYYMYKGMTNNGCEVVSTPKRGDIVFYKCNKCTSTADIWCHVGIMVNATTSIDGNFGGKVAYDSSFTHKSGAHSVANGAVVKIYVRPKYDDPYVYKKGAEMTGGSDRTLPDGNYIIASAGVGNKREFYYLDISGVDVPAPIQSNVSLYGPFPADASHRFTPADVWTLKYSDGFYTITQMGTDMSLDLADGSLYEHANIQVYKSHNGPAQQWAICYNGRDGYRIQSKCSGFALDVTDWAFTAGTNIQQWSVNDGAAQSWLFIPYQPEQPVEDGRYVLLSALDESFELDAPGDTGTLTGMPNIQIWKDTAQSRYNAFDVKKLDNGYYTIIHAASGLSLDVNGGASARPVNVQLCAQNGTAAQLWSIEKKGDYYVLQSYCNGYALDVADAITENGTNVHSYPYHGGECQQWKFVKAEYTVTYNANGGSGAPAGQTKYYKEDLKLSTAQPERKEYIFTGWNTRGDGSGTAYAAGAAYKADADITLYAQWEPDYMLGDVDGDGNVTSADARLALRQAVGLENYLKGFRAFICCDVDLNGAVTANDARLILRRSVGYIDREFGAEA